MTQAGPSNSSNRIGSNCSWWLLAGLALFIIFGLLCLLVLVPAGVRALPGRYAARLPGFLQELRHRPHPDVLPTPAITVTPFLWFAPTSTPYLSAVTIFTATPGESARSSALVPTVLEPTLTQSRPTDTPTHLVVEPTVAPTRPEERSTDTPTHTPQEPTPRPTNTSTATATAAATPPYAEPPIRASLPPITHTYQTWNNCGPATLSMALTYFGRTETQVDAAAFLKPDPEDKNVSPHEMVAYARSLGLEATVRMDGDLTRLKQLIAAGFPVVVETWFIPEPGDQMGHYRLLTGYDDDVGQFITQDSYNGPNVRLNYAAFDELWRVFNRLYLVAYYPSQADLLAAMLGDDWDDQAMFAEALTTAQVEAVTLGAECVAYEDCADGSAFAWFNVGSSLNALGRHEQAAAAYDQARVLGLPWRMLWYQFGPYEAYYAVGRYEDVVTLATVTLNVVNNLEESHYWRGMAYLAQENVDRARDDFKAAVKYNPNFAPAVEALESLE